MRHGLRSGSKQIARVWKDNSRWGIGLFIEDGAYTTVASAVAMLVVLSLVFSASLAVWSSSRAGDVQVAADASALAGANVVSSYHTAATVVDASVLSLGLAGFTMAGVGLVALLVPGAHAAGGEMIDASVRTLKMRNEFAESASRGLKTLEQSLPYLVAANATRTCSAQDSEHMEFTGTALALPRTSASEFPALEGERIETDALEQAADELDEVASELERAAEETAAKKEAAWIADCGRDGMNMQERASRLSGISTAENPDFASSITWEPNVALARARAYYRWRYNHDAPEGSSVEARADAAARHEFYGYALEVLQDAQVVERDGQVYSNVKLLPKNMTEVRSTRLYTDVIWPSSVEGDGLTLHFSSSCPGAKGAAGPALSLSSIDAGSARECSVCRFSVGDVGKTPAASTSIDNGFEYHLREFTLALDEYVAARNVELELERKAQAQAEDAGNAFEDALAVLAGKRPRIAPPGRNGCVALVTSAEADVPETLETSFAQGSSLDARGAISAAVLAPETATRENNVLASFLSSVEERAGSDGAVGLIGSVMDLWGDLLLGYGDMSAALDEAADDLLGGVSSFGLGPVGTWLKDRVQGVVHGLGFEAVDLSLRKPVLTDSANVLSHSGMTGLADAQGLLRSLPAGTTDPAALLQAVGYDAGEYMASLEFTLAEIPLPGGGSIPLTIRLRDIAGMLGGS